LISTFLSIIPGTLHTGEYGCSIIVVAAKAKVSGVKMKSKTKKCTKVESLEEFLKKIEDINEDIATISGNVDKLKTVNSKIINEPSQVERKKLVTVQEDIIQRNKSVGKKLQKVIKEEKKKLASIPNDLRSSDFTIKDTQLKNSSKRFFDLWTQYNNIQLDYREKNKSKLLRLLTSGNSTLSPEEIEEKLDNGDVSVFSAIIKETNQAKEDLKMLENRHLEIMKLEKGISEINDMFIELSHLISEQGETIDRIEDHVNNAAAEVESARGQLKEAEKKQKSARRMKFILAGILAGVAIIVVIILAILLG